MHGNVTVDNAANINAASGVGIGLYNFGVGNLSATIRPTSTVTAISAGVNAFAQGGGSVSIVNQGVIIANSGAGITVGTGTGTPNSVSGVISINNSGAITSLGSSASPAIQINNASTQAAILTNSGTITANLFGKAASNVAVAAYNGSIAITNTGTISGNVSLASATINNAASGTWRVSGTNFLGSAASITNAGTIAIYGLSYFNAAILFALANSGTINLQANSTAIVGANVTGAGTFNIGDRSMLELVGSVAAGQTISFAAGRRGVLTLDNPSNFQGSISGLASGDLINLWRSHDLKRKHNRHDADNHEGRHHDADVPGHKRSAEHDVERPGERQDRCGAHDGSDNHGAIDAVFQQSVIRANLHFRE